METAGESETKETLEPVRQEKSSKCRGTWYIKLLQRTGSLS